MNTYSQLSLEERYIISTEHTRKTSFADIGRMIDRPTSTISREFHRNLRPTGRYAASVANSYAHARRRWSRRGSQFSLEQWNRIVQLIKEEYSPEQVISQLLKEGYPHISIQTIYRHIKKNRRRGGHLYKHLRIMPKRRKKKYRSADSRGVLRGKRNIAERPMYINERKTCGHWEGDTIIGQDHHQCIITLVDRKSGANRMAKLKNKTAKETSDAIIAIIKKEPRLFKTITFDNGTEFHSYKEIERQTGIKIYFANPHHPWERGCNENFNGLVRQYIPKGKSLRYIGDIRLQKISVKLNLRPRKRLGFKSPQEVIYG